MFDTLNCETARKNFEIPSLEKMLYAIGHACNMNGASLSFSNNGITNFFTEEIEEQLKQLGFEVVKNEQTTVVSWDSKPFILPPVAVPVDADLDTQAAQTPENVESAITKE